MKFLERSIIGGEGLYFGVFGILWFGILGGLLQGYNRLLGVLGLRERNPYGILELGSRIGYS
jgi:hypothetical protein